MCDGRGDSCTDCVVLFIGCLLRSEAGSFIKYWATFQLELSKREWGLLTWKRDDPPARRNPQAQIPSWNPLRTFRLWKASLIRSAFYFRRSCLCECLRRTESVRTELCFKVHREGKKLSLTVVCVFWKNEVMFALIPKAFFSESLLTEY